MKEASTFSELVERQLLLTKAYTSPNPTSTVKKTTRRLMKSSTVELGSQHVFGEQNQMKKNTLVLDLQKTLMYAKTAPFENYTHINVTVKKSEMMTYYLAPRPRLVPFLELVSQYFDLVLFTNKNEAYAKDMLETLEISKYFSKVYSKDDCRSIEGIKPFKDLAKIGVPMKNVILVDGCERQAYLYSFNAFNIKQFTGDTADCELDRVSSFLMSVWKFDDVRPIAKRWQLHLDGKPGLPDASIEARSGRRKSPKKRPMTQIETDKKKEKDAVMRQAQKSFSMVLTSKATEVTSQTDF